MPDPTRFRRLTGALVLVLTLLSLAAVPAFAGKKSAPETAEAQLAFGVDMARRGLWSEALFRFKQAARMEPGNPRVLNNLAVAYEALGNFDKALDFYQQAIKSDPANKELKRNYSRFVEFYRSFRPDRQEGTATASEGAGEEEVAQGG